MQTSPNNPTAWVRYGWVNRKGEWTHCQRDLNEWPAARDALKRSRYRIVYARIEGSLV